MANQSIQKKYIAIKKDDFAKSRFKKFEHYGHAAYDSIMPVVMAEANFAMKELPLVFMQNDSKEKYSLFALSSLIPDINLLVDSRGAFRTQYVPAYYRAYPFMFANADNGEKVLCIDENSGLILKKGNEGELFFDSKGNVSEFIQGVIEFIQTVSESAEETQKAIRLLNTMGLIAPWKPTVKMGNVEQTIEGIYGIDEKKLNALKGADLVKLRDSGALALAYAQIFSTQNLRFIAQLTQAVLAAQGQKQSANENLVDNKGDLKLDFLNQNDTIPV